MVLRSVEPAFLEPGHPWACSLGGELRCHESSRGVPSPSVGNDAPSTDPALTATVGVRTVPDMPPLEAFGPFVGIALILLVMLWFALGTQRNIAKGNALLRWLQTGLPILGRRTTLRWLGSSAVELGIVEPALPFREATVVIVLEPRDVSVLWALARSRGRRDFVIVRLNLVRAPRFSMDVRDPRGWTSRSEAHAGDLGREGGTNGANDGDWQALDWEGGCVAHAGPGADDAAVRSAWRRLTEATGVVWRLTVQPVVPHLEVQFRPPVSNAVSADRVLSPIRELGAALAER